MRGNAVDVVTHAVSSSCHVRNEIDDEASRAKQTHQVTKAHRIINSSTSRCFLELVCVRESGETLQIYINILKISKAEWLSKMNSKIAKIEIWLVVHKKPLTQAVKRLLPACALFRCMSTFLRMLRRMAQQNSSTKQNKISIVTSPITMLGNFDLLLRTWTRRMCKKNVGAICCNETSTTGN